MTQCQSPWRWRAGLFALTAAGLAARLVTLPRVPDEHDSYFFVRGVIRFSIAEVRPHWPGYPVYIWVGKLATALLGDPVLALHCVSALASALVAWPLAVVGRAWARSLGAPAPRSEWAGWAAAALWLATPAAWVTGSQIVGDPLGLLCGVALLALAVSAEEGRPGRWLWAAALGGVMLGVRLVNVSMLGPLVWRAWRARRERWHSLPIPAALVLAFATGVLPWAGWLAIRESRTFVSLGRQHVTGHFGRWGESLLTDREPLDRPWKAATTLVVYGLGGGTPRQGRLRALASVAWLAALVLGCAQRPWRGTVAVLVALWGGPHLLHLFVAHDVAYPKYAMPAVALASLIAGLAALSPRRWGPAAVMAAVAGACAVSAPVAWHQRQEPPVEDRAARFLAAQDRAAVAVVDVPGLPTFLRERADGVPWIFVAPDAVARFRRRWEAEGRRVFATAVPPDEASGWTPVAHFCRDPFIDPRLGPEVWLFAPARGLAAPPVVECAAAE